MASKGHPTSYNAGEKGRNWVRAYEDRPGKFYLEWMEPEVDPITGAVVTVVDRRSGKEKPIAKRKRVLLPDVSDLDGAKAKADVLAAKFAEEPPTPEPSSTVTYLLTRYVQEATPKKSESKRDHDYRAAGIFKREYGDKDARHLDRADWDNFVSRRSKGEIDGFGPVAPRQVEYDLKFLIAVLTWAMGVRDARGRPLLEVNPWGAERRKALGMKMPKGSTPHRPTMPDWIREELIEHAPNPQFALALKLGRYTISRNSSVRTAMWRNVDLHAGTVRWLAEHDKNNQDVTVPLMDEALEALRSAPRQPGDIWFFPPRGIAHGRRLATRFRPGCAGRRKRGCARSMMTTNGSESEPRFVGSVSTRRSELPYVTRGFAHWLRRQRKSCRAPATRRWFGSTTRWSWTNYGRPFGSARGSGRSPRCGQRFGRDLTATIDSTGVDRPEN